MAAFKRVYRSFPGYDVLTNIESVNILDIAPPGRVLGTGTGTQLVVGEFERGPFVPTEIFGPSDLVTTFGGLGHPTANSPYDGATARKSGGDELWNGNGFIWLRNKRFNRVLIQRVDNSVGVVRLQRLACLTGGAGPFTGLTSGATVQLTRNGVTLVTATFTGNAAQITGVAGTFPTLFVGGETLEVQVDNDAPRVIVMTAAEQTNTQVVARINAVLAQNVASVSGGQIRLSSVIQGQLGRIEVVGGSARATLGLPLAATQQVSTVTINSNATPGVFTLTTTRYVGGVLTSYARTYTSTGGQTTAQVRDGLLAAFTSNPIPGITAATAAGSTFTLTGAANILFTPTVTTEPAVGEMTIAATTPGVVVIDEGDGNVPNIAEIEASSAALVFDALAGIDAGLDGDGNLRVCNVGTPGTGTLQVTGGTAYATFGFDLTTIAAANDGEDVTIQAGARFQDSTATGTIWVAIEDVDTGTGGGPFDVRVRPWDDTDSAFTSTAGNVTLILDVLPDGFSVTNPANLTRLSASQLDSRYRDALEVTLDQSSVAYTANVVAAARTSQSIMRYLKENALAATRDGMFARKYVMRPPLGTARDAMKAATGVGVANTTHSRDERGVYVGIGFTTQIPEIQRVGARGGLGFTDDGIIEVGGDSFYCSVRSILPPEENAGQRLTDTNVEGLNVLSLEDAYNPEAGGVNLKIEDYISFKANGIVAARIDRVSGAIFQSDVTSVDPLIDPALVDANRRWFADFVIDTLGEIGVKFVKKLASATRRRALLTEVTGYLKGLLSENQPASQRIAGFQIINETTTEQEELGIVVFVVKVRMLATIKALVFRTEIGATVQIEQLAA